MDTTTVLEIIKIIDCRISYLSSDYYHGGNLSDSGCRKERVAELTVIHNHLQSYIEAQVNAIENQGSE
jgi:hypothetical protein